MYKFRQQNNNNVVKNVGTIRNENFVGLSVFPHIPSVLSVYNLYIYTYTMYVYR